MTDSIIKPVLVSLNKRRRRKPVIPWLSLSDEEDKQVPVPVNEEVLLRLALPETDEEEAGEQYFFGRRIQEGVWVDGSDSLLEVDGAVVTHWCPLTEPKK